MVHDYFVAEEVYYHQQIDYLTAKEFGLAVKQIDNYINSQATYLKTEISADCQNIIWGFANYPQDYEDLILKMIRRSGKQINDLGKYAEWMADTYETRYMIQYIMLSSRFLFVIYAKFHIKQKSN